MDENEALSGQGAENAQGEHPNNQTMESLLESRSLNVELPQVGEIRKGVIASIGASQILSASEQNPKALLRVASWNNSPPKNALNSKLDRKLMFLCSTLKIKTAMSFCPSNAHRKKCPGKMLRR